MAAAIAAPGASATDLQVYPVRILLDPQNPTAVVTLINRGDTDTLLQLGVAAWEQDAGADKLTQTRDILANPGVFLLKAGEQQIARIALRVPQDVKERSYRIVVQEVPRQRIANGLSTVLRLLVPVFVPVPNPTVALQWEARPIPGGVEVVAHNSGNVHVQIRAIKATGDRIAPAGKALNLYILPGATGLMRITMPNPPAAGSMLQLSGESDQGNFSAMVQAGAMQGVSGQP